MRANTRKIYERLIRGAFLSEDSIDRDVRGLYTDIEENYADYHDYFLELGLRLEAGQGYYYFSRAAETKLTIEQKLESFAQWVDILDFLKTFDIAFGTGYQFRSAQILEQINRNLELRDKARKLFRKEKTNSDVVEKLVKHLVDSGFAELINNEDQTYKVVSAFRYAEDLVNLITIYNEEETPES